MQTPFTDKLHTNYVPLSFEIDQIHQVIAKPLDDISQLNEKIAHLQAIIDDLSRERDELSRFVEDHRALLSGVRQLPKELVQDIFLSCLPNDRNAVMSSAEAPVLLGRICKSWRQIALSTPQLWSSLHIPIPDPTYLLQHGRGKLLQRGAVVKAWLERSGSCSLSLSVIYESAGNPREREESLFAARYFLLAIIDFSKRWKDVDFVIPFSIYHGCLIPLEKTDVPVLEKIHFHLLCEDSQDLSSVETWHSGPILQTPSLCHITLFLQVRPRTDFVLHWERLTHLSLAGSPLPSMRALDILSQCSKLISCKMALEPRVENEGASLTITLPFLRSFEIVEGSFIDGDMKYFFETLSLPSLQHFKYRGHIMAQHDADVPFKSIMTQAQTPGIESLDLTLAAPRVGLLLECLPLLPSLTRLALSETIYHCDLAVVDNDLLTLLTPSAGSGECVCPRLEEVRFDGCNDVTDDVICLFLTARTSSTSLRLYPQIARLKRAKFSFARHRNTDIFPQLLPLMEEGLEVHLGYRPQGDWCSPWRGLQGIGDTSIWMS
jgi:hypothetical protein